MEFSYRRWLLFKNIVFLSIVYFCFFAVFLNAVALITFNVHIIPHFAEFSFVKNIFGGLLGLAGVIIFTQILFPRLKAFIKKENAFTLKNNILTIHTHQNQQINVHDIAYFKVTFGPSVKKDKYFARLALYEEENADKAVFLSPFSFQNGTIRTLRKIKHLTGAKFKIDASPLRHQNCFSKFIYGPGHY